MRDLVVVDMGTANMFSLTSALQFLGAAFDVSASPERVRRASHLILPGVGAFQPAAAQLRRDGMLDALRFACLTRECPILGVCLGMQLLFERSDEGDGDGVGLFDGGLRALSPSQSGAHRVPHVGFAPVSGFVPTGVFDGFDDDPMFYFTHSFARRESIADANAAWCAHTEPFVAAVQKRNVCGVQFHPEKSQVNGLRLLANFLRQPAGQI
jgi:imidazole glycerol-phosphate synthase subunit HisH